jgi:hypothetical protein
VLNYHPIQNGICSPMINDYKFTVSVGASLEDAAIVLHLIARACRSASRTSSTSFRIWAASSPCCSSASTTRRRASPEPAERPSVTARRFFYDIVGHGSQAALLCAWKAFGADHLVAGSDYPSCWRSNNRARTSST